MDAPVVALTHALLIDGTGTAPRADQTVIINGSRIASVGPTASTAVPAGARVIDLTGYTIAPGLVGLHEHTYFGGVRQVTQMSVSAPLLYLGFGVTTAMTAGSQLPYHERSMQHAVDAGRLPGPQFLISGPYLDGAGARNAMSRALESPQEAQRVVNYWADEGATWIKVLGSISRDMLGHVIRAAHARGIKVTGHLCSVTFVEASELGIDALQHGFITASDYVAGKIPDVCPNDNMVAQANVDVASEAVQSTIREIARRKTPVVSTLAVYETFSPTRFRPDTAALAMLDSTVRREVEANIASSGKGGGYTVSEVLLRKMMRWERDFVAAGGLLGAGCDPWGTGFLPGFGDVRNYELLVEAGFTPAIAMQVLTLNGARILGLDAEIGTVTIGKRADLIVIRGDPVVRPSDLYQMTTIFKAGIGYDALKLRSAAKGLVGVR